MQTIQEIFLGRFEGTETAVVQKLFQSEKNLNDMRQGFSEHWPTLFESPQLLVLSFGQPSLKIRQLWGGFITDVLPSEDPQNKGLYRICVDRFHRIGEHNLNQVPDGVFYGHGGGGGSRTYVKKIEAITNKSSNRVAPPGEMIQRLLWVRKNHHNFCNPVWEHWDGKCAVYDSYCDGLLVASHIYPWSKSSEVEQTDVNNGLLLSVPLDKLFDSGLISFSSTGEIIIKEHVSSKTRTIFGLSNTNLKITRINKLTPEMVRYLKRHRKFHGFK